MVVSSVKNELERIQRRILDRTGTLFPVPLPIVVMPEYTPNPQKFSKKALALDFEQFPDHRFKR
jgi:hypothetical protein